MGSYPTRQRQRLAGFDYTTAGCYFITLCLQGRLPLFGQVSAGTLHPSPAGVLMEQTLLQVPDRHPGVAVDTLIVMPDHLHAILTLDPGAPSLSSIFQWFKGQSTARYARGVRAEGWMAFSGKLWQRGFYDRVIRSEEELNAIWDYVLTNPERWSMRNEG